jgi:hypothetical protein
MSDTIIDTYLGARFGWLDSYSRPSRLALRASLAALGEAVVRGDPAHYQDYASDQIRTLIAAGSHPVALLAAGDLLYDIVLGVLTTDQRDLVAGILDVERRHRQRTVYDAVIAPVQERGA